MRRGISVWFLRSAPQCLADSEYGHVLALGYACPGVAGYVGGQGVRTGLSFLWILSSTAW